MKKIILFLCFVLYTSTLNAKNAFFIPDIRIQAEASSSIEAKEIALFEGQKHALEKIIQRISGTKNELDMPPVTQEDMLSLVQNISLAQEQTTPTKYIAILSVQFNQQALREWLQQYNIKILTQFPPSILILPVLTTEEGIFFLENNNPLLNALKENNFTSLYTLKIPAGDLEDVSRFTPDSLYSGDFSSFSFLLNKYNAEQILIIEAKKEGDFYSAKTRLFPKDTSLSNVAALIHAPLEEEFVWKKLLQQVLLRLDENWLQAKLSQQGEMKELTVTVPITSLQEWTQIKKTLDHLSVLEKVEVLGLKKEQAVLKITFQTSYQDLSDLLYSKNLALSQQEDGEWFLIKNISSETSEESLQDKTIKPLNLLSANEGVL